MVYCKLYIWRIDFRFRLGAIRSELIWTIFNEHVHGTHIWLVWVGFSFWIGLGLGFRLWSIRSELIWTCYTPLGGALSQVPPAHLVHTRKLHTNAVNTQQVSNFLEALDLAQPVLPGRDHYTAGGLFLPKRGQEDKNCWLRTLRGVWQGKMGTAVYPVRTWHGGDFRSSRF